MKDETRGLFFSIHQENFAALQQLSSAQRYKLHVAKQDTNDLSAFVASGGNIVQTVSWSGGNIQVTFSTVDIDVRTNLADFPEEVLQFQFPLSQMHKLQPVITDGNIFFVVF